LTYLHKNLLELAVRGDEIRLDYDDGPSRAPGASGQSAAGRGPILLCMGLFRDFVSGPVYRRRVFALRPGNDRASH